jgi:hypothetical protein
MSGKCNALRLSRHAPPTGYAGWKGKGAAMRRIGAGIWTGAACLCAAVALTAGTVPAGAAVRTAGLPGTGGPAACGPAQLRVSVPEQVRGDPQRGMDKQSWNIVLRNTGTVSCSLRGWPVITARAAGGRAVPLAVRDATFSNLAAVPERQVILAPGDAAVVTAMSADELRGCTISWTLAVRLPGSAAAAAVPAPHGVFVPCLGGPLVLSPFYPLAALLRDIKAMSASSVPPPFAASAAAEPPACQAAVLRGSLATTQRDGRNGFLAVLRLRTAGPPCTLNEVWPTVRLDETGGQRPVAKVFSSAAADRAARPEITTYVRGRSQRAALTLRPGAPASVAVVAAGTGACQRLTAAELYPGPLALGPSLRIAVPGPARICGVPRILPFLPASRTGPALAVTRAALTTVTAAPGDSPAGYVYGTDSAFPLRCHSSVPYLEPNGVCANGTKGNYGAYVGEAGSWANWQKCSTGRNWLQSNYNAAQANAAAGDGLGAAPYWFADGPGRDPGYNGTTAEAKAWGAAQAKQMITHALGNAYSLPYVVEDVENAGAPPDENGWNTIWTGPCTQTQTGSSIPAAVDFATFQGFRNYIEANSAYAPAVYSAGGGGYGSWSGIFGSGFTLKTTAEWTFTEESTNVAFPSGFSNPFATALFFASAPARCQLAWQFSGGNGDINQYGGDYDQINGNNATITRCE